MADFVEWNPKHHGHKPLHWTPDMLTSVDGKNFVRQPNWAWIAGSTYYVPHEAVGMVRKDVGETMTEIPHVEDFSYALVDLIEDYKKRGMEDAAIVAALLAAVITEGAEQ